MNVNYTVRNKMVTVAITSAAVLICSSMIAAQTTTAHTSPPTKVNTAKAAHDDDSSQQGLSLLRQAIAQCGNYDPASRAAVYYLAGHALTKIRPQLASDSLSMAYRTFDQLRGDKSGGLDGLEGNIVRETALVMPSQVEGALPQDESMRATALSALVEAYVKQKKIDHAIELVALIPDPDVYTPVRQLLQAIPATDQERRSRVFSYAIEQYSTTVHTANIVGYPDDLGKLTVEFWRTLPARRVLNAIDILLDEADPAKHQSETTSSNHAERVTLGDANGTRVLGFFDYRLNQVIPILRTLDPARADSLSDKRATQPEKPAAAKAQTSREHIAIVRNDAATSEQVVAMEQTRIAEAIVASADTDPQAAVAKAEAMQDRVLASRILVSIASSYVSKDPKLAASVLNRVRDDKSFVPSAALDEAINVALKLDPDLAKAFLEAKFSRAETQFKKDSDPDHPNGAIKLYWPSTSGWRDALRLAYKFSASYSVEKLKSIPDAEIQSMERAMLACSFLRVPVWSDSPIGTR